MIITGDFNSHLNTFLSNNTNYSGNKLIDLVNKYELEILNN